MLMNRCNAPQQSLARRSCFTAHELVGRVLFGLLAFLMLHCVPPPPPPPPEAPEPPRYPLASKLLMVSEDVRMTSLDGKWSISSDSTPAQIGGTATACGVDWDTGGWRAALAQQSRVYVQRVRVVLEDRKLWGILMLCGIPTNSTGPASRAYRIEVPDTYVEATSGGRVSMVFEHLNNDRLSWVLWLSRERFE